MKIANLFKKLVCDKAQESGEGQVSVEIRDPEIIKKFISNPENTFFISFPRTGSHWLRILMELYFQRPSLVRAFYYPECHDYLTYHTHDLDLDIVHPIVLYLYRNPLDTIYSQLAYHKEAYNDTARIIYWSDLYGRHLDKWLHQEKFTSKKTVLRYENLKVDMLLEFSKVTNHFGLNLDGQKLAEIKCIVTKEETKRKTMHDKQVVSSRMDYEEKRKEFSIKNYDVIWEALLRNRSYLRNDFST